jgi:NMD protein affecting ribosome stability and mRNA decay
VSTCPSCGQPREELLLGPLCSRCDQIWFDGIVDAHPEH